jgi:hypothetical protein
VPEKEAEIEGVWRGYIRGGGYKLAAVKAGRQCPFVLLVKVEWRQTGGLDIKEDKVVGCRMFGICGGREYRVIKKSLCTL